MAVARTCRKEWELQLLRNGDFYAGRRFHLREQAIRHGAEIRKELEADGWSDTD